MPGFEAAPSSWTGASESFPDGWGRQHHGDAANFTIGEQDPPGDPGEQVVTVTVPGSVDQLTRRGHDLRTGWDGMELHGYEAATLSYEVWVPAEPGLEWGSAGGKLPGLAGTTSDEALDIPTGGAHSTSAWSGRLHWIDGGALKGYLYAQEARGMTPPEFGIALPLLDSGGSPLLLNAGAWNTIAITYVMNTPGVADGVFRCVLNGVMGADDRDVMYRDADHPTLGVNHMIHQLYYGGNGAVGPVNDQTWHFRKHVVTAYA